MPETLEGRMLGHCRVEKLLGEGGMAKVYLGHHETLDKKVAVKVLSPALAADREFVQRFLREARAAAKLDHPNVVQVYDAGSAGEVNYMVMQFIEGTDLHSYLKKAGKLPVKDVIAAGKRVASALAAAHDRGLIHRDVKPSNIMIGKGGKVFVTDFGLARDTSTNMELTRTDTVMGSPHYMSPEQAMGEKLDGRTDIYSLGASLYHMLTGKTPYDGPTPAVIMLKHTQPESAPDPLRKIVPDVPAELDALIMKMMAKKREERPASMKAVLEAFEKMKPADLGPTVVAAPAVTPKLRRRYMLMGAGLALGALVVLGILLGGDKVSKADALMAEAQKLEAAGNLEAAISKYGEVAKAAPGTTAATSAETRIKELEGKLDHQRGEARIALAVADFNAKKAAFTTTYHALEQAQKDYAGTALELRATDALDEVHLVRLGERAQQMVKALTTRGAEAIDILVDLIDPELKKHHKPEEIRRMCAGLLILAKVSKASCDPGDIALEKDRKSAFVGLTVVGKNAEGKDEVNHLPLEWIVRADDWYISDPGKKPPRPERPKRPRDLLPKPPEKNP